MKIWEKNYILTMVLLMALLFGSIFFIQQYSFRKNLDQYCMNSFLNENRIEFSLSSFLPDERETGRLSRYCQSLQSQDIYLRVKHQGKTLVDSRPFLWDSSGKKDVQIVKEDHRVYICIASSWKDPEYGKIGLLYLEEISDLYKLQQKQMLFLLLLAVLLAVLLLSILYSVMKRIYTPVSNIAHELRTPLTAIQGYAQYILLGSIDKEDMIFAGGQIDIQARHMNALIETLLIMGNLRDGEITMKRMDTGEIIEELIAYFPFVSVDDQVGYLYGDKTLMLSLLRNLLSNTCRQGENIRLQIRENTVTIYNQDDYIEEKLLELLNKGHFIPDEKIQGRGLGVPLCREIVKKHRGKLQYQNLPEGGVEITILLWQS